MRGLSGSRMESIAAGAHPPGSERPRARRGLQAPETRRITSSRRQPSCRPRPSCRRPSSSSAAFLSAAFFSSAAFLSAAFLSAFLSAAFLSAAFFSSAAFLSAAFFSSAAFLSAAFLSAGLLVVGLGGLLSALPSRRPRQPSFFGSSFLRLGLLRLFLRRRLGLLRLFLLRVGLGRRVHLRGAGERDVLADLVEGGVADPVDLLHVLERLERTVLLAIVDDGLRLHRADAVQRLELFLGRGIDVHGRKRDARVRDEGQKEPDDPFHCHPLCLLRGLSAARESGAPPQGAARFHFPGAVSNPGRQ